MSSADELKAAGNACLQAKDFDGAIEKYTAAIALDGTNHVFYSNRSAAHLSKGNAMSALEDAEKCVEIKADWPKGYSRKGAALHALKRYEDAMSVYEKGLEISPEDAGLKSGLTEVRRAKASFESQAQNPFARIFGPEALMKLAQHPKYKHLISDQNFLQKLGMMRSNPQAISSFLTDPEMQGVLGFLMGLDFQAMGSEGDNMEEDTTPPGPSFSDFTQHAPPSAPNSSSSSGSGGSGSGGKKEEEKEEEEEVVDLEAMTEAERAQYEKRKEGEKAKDEGNAFYKEKKFEEAADAYDRAISLFREAKEAKGLKMIAVCLNNKAAVALEQKDFDRCIDICKEAVATGREHQSDFTIISKCYLRIGKAYERKKELEQAIEAYQNAQVENYTKATERLIKELQLKKRKMEADAYIDPEKANEAKEKGNEFFRAQDYPNAIKMYEEAVKRAPTSAPLRNNLAAALSKMGDFNGAKTQCEKALELDPTYVKAWSKKGDIEFFMKEYHRAMTSYQEGLKREPENSLCLQGLQRTVQMVNQQASSGEVDEERAAHALADPEIQSILHDPIISSVLRDFQENPKEAQKAMQDASVAAKLEKLIAAGILKVGSK